MEEKKEGLFRIGEVAGLFHISIGTLRHYEKMGLLKPEYTDEATGYRYYGIRQFECLNTIRYLRVLDMPLEEIREFLDSRDTDKIQQLLRKQKEEVAVRQEKLRRIQQKIDNRLKQIEDALHSRPEEIREEMAPAIRLAFLETQVKPETYLDLEHVIRQLDQEEPVAFLGKVGIGISKEKLEAEEYGVYDRVFVVLEEEDRFQKETLVLPPQRCVAVRFHGTHRQAGEYYKRLREFMEKRGYGPAGFSREITMIDEGMTCDPSKFVTEIQIPVV